jgi:hypothetical protein
VRRSFAVLAVFGLAVPSLHAQQPQPPPSREAQPAQSAQQQQQPPHPPQQSQSQEQPSQPSRPPGPPQATPPGTTISGTISGLTITGATVTGATITGATITGATISGATLSGAAISGAAISGNTIAGGTVSGGTVTGGTVSGGTISGGTISGGTISGGSISANPASGKGVGSPEAQPPPGAPPARDDGAKRPPRSDSRGDVKTDSDRRGQRSTKGDDEDEEELAARALQRALVQRGALLLPVWGIEIAPGITYGHASQDTFIALPAENGSVTVGARKRSHQLSGVVTVRVGLPWDLQVEGSVPGLAVWNDAVLGGAASSDASGIGLGDPRVSVTRQLVHAGKVMPDILVTATWKPHVGSSPFNAGAGEVGLGSGYSGVGGTIQAVKAADPLVLLVSAGYTDNLAVTTSQGQRKPGNTWSAGGGAILAVSPETSMSFLLDFHYKPQDEVAGKAVLGSDETIAVLQLGLGMVLSRSVLLNLTAGIGLTADSTGFQFGVSAPVRF